MPIGAKTHPLYLVSIPNVKIIVVIFVGIAIEKNHEHYCNCIHFVLGHLHFPFRSGRLILDAFILFGREVLSVTSATKVFCKAQIQKTFQYS